MRHLRTAALAAVLAAAATPAAAETTGWQDMLDRGRAEALRLEDQARGLIVQAGAVLFRYRHTVAGAALGCATGSLVGVGSTVALGAVSGGATLVASGPAALVGCAVGAAGGAAMGHPLDAGVSLE